MMLQQPSDTFLALLAQTLNDLLSDWVSKVHHAERRLLEL